MNVEEKEEGTARLGDIDNPRVYFDVAKFIRGMRGDTNGFEKEILRKAGWCVLEEVITDILLAEGYEE